MNESTPLVSVIVPTFNRRQKLLRALMSVTNQSFRDFEIIVIDNHSTDDTKEMIAGLENPKIRFLSWLKRRCNR